VAHHRHKHIILIDLWQIKPMYRRNCPSQLCWFVIFRCSI